MHGVSAIKDEVSRPSNSEAVVRIKNLTKTYRRRGKSGDLITPVDNVTLDILSNELVVLLGPSGCGKTTLLRCVAGLERPDSGEIEIAGEVVYSSERNIFIPPERRGINMIFQSYALWPHMSVFDNVAFPLRSIGTKGNKISELVLSVLDVVGLNQLERQYPAQLSGGQQQRVALARAIVARDPVVLFDEPLSNVDAKVREQLRAELISLKRRIGFSALYVTHDQHEALTLGDKIAVLNSGVISQYDVPQNIYKTPANRYVGEFVGAANIIDGTVLALSHEQVIVQTRLGRIVSGGQLHSTLEIGASVEVLTRPEDWRLSKTREHSINSWEMTLEEARFAGPYTECTVSTEDISLRIWAVRSRRFLEMHEGDQVAAEIDPSDVHILKIEESA